MEKKEDPNELQELLQTLEQQTNWDGRRLVKYDGFWSPDIIVRPILSAQKYFKAKDSDIILTSIPKSGTTWLKALVFSIANRNVISIDQSPLLTSHPHTVVPFLEFNLYLHQENPDLQALPSPRIFTTHMPFKILPDSIRESECKIIYICRNPLDQFVLHRHFLLENKLEKDAEPLAIDTSFDLFCRGIHPFGPFWDHILGYWNAGLKNPEKVLFLRYEELKEDITPHVKKIAEFIGSPFSPEEEKQGVVDQISRLCSFENLRNLEVNKKGYILGVLKNSSFFRKGHVGDWINRLTPSMAERFKDLMRDKFEGSGLIFKI
ncbi:UNVERIFIED_CONTAM: Cytosolic sulfotransferase 15 [Sesamum radiatum]|uniref:Sulfotransferase n=1 Tax=Sesamum radiatum TaxID=300843 RepID=A0AAW2JRY1_SESRA